MHQPEPEDLEDVAAEAQEFLGDGAQNPVSETVDTTVLSHMHTCLLMFVGRKGGGGKISGTQKAHRAILLCFLSQEIIINF